MKTCKIGTGTGASNLQIDNAGILLKLATITSETLSAFTARMPDIIRNSLSYHDTVDRSGEHQLTQSEDADFPARIE
jgi:hypothetical protein